MFKFSIDKISKIESNKFNVSIMPDINSEFFPPYHLRNVYVGAELLEERLYNYWNYNDENLNEYRFKGSVVQGGYYRMSRELFYSIYRSKKDLASIETLINRDNDIFYDHLETSPYDDSRRIMSTREEKVISGEKSFEFLSSDNFKFKCVYLYCFNVGQGDSFLLITSSGNAYLIDSNVYNQKSAKDFSYKVQQILRKHGLKKQLKGIIITHKHIDHIRGLSFILSNGLLSSENFIINLDYIHNTKAVDSLMNSASLNISTWINLNRSGIIREGDTTICVENPDYNSSTLQHVPDINDSSIGLCIQYKDTQAYLTGDLGSRMICAKFKNSNYKNNFLKVSHHGSETGTNNSVINLINPDYAYISAGTNKRLQHPHHTVVSLLNKQGRDLKISKIIGRDVCYEFSKDGIDWTLL